MTGRRIAPLAAACLSTILLLAGAGPAAALADAPQTVRVDLNGAGSQMLTLPRGKSAVVELPTDARDVLVTDPKVAEIALRTPRRIFVMGMESGRTDAVFFDAAGRRILSLNIRVDADISAVEDTLHRVVPGSAIRVEAAGENLILTGEVGSASESDKAERVAQRYVSNPKMVLNALSIRGKEQVMLKVRVVEVQRTVIKQLGVDFNTVLNQIGEPQYILGSTATFALNGAFLGGSRGGYDLDTTRQPFAVERSRQFSGNFDSFGRPIFNEVTNDVVARDYPLSVPKETAGDPGLNKAESTIKAFERVGLVRTLAEPNLTAISGESARFLAGGEFPVPVGSDDQGRTVIQFKPYGVGLGFTPVVLSEGRISLRVSTEVSELTNQGAFTLVGGVSIPALSVRRAETTVELPSGGAIMMAGLLQARTKQNLDKVPGLGSLPVLGALFRSRDFLNDETELVIIVTPYLVQPTSPGRLQTPADGLKIADDLQTVFLGKLNEVYRPGAAGAAPYQGPVGPVIE